jgi:predicted ATPase
MDECRCLGATHDAKLVVLTGGPGAGKTAVLEVIRRNFCPHVVVLPEAASILFSGGFPRRETTAAMRSAQRAIFWVQRELERMALEEHRAALVLCDRGTIDGSAYWPGKPDELFRDVGTTLKAELARYAAVIHLRTPAEHAGYDFSNPVRTETAEQASVIDDRIASAWSEHPRRFVVENQLEFVEKLARAIALIEREVPSCCRPRRASALER